MVIWLQYRRRLGYALLRCKLDPSLGPPVALSAYFSKAVVPECNLKGIYGGMIQCMGIQLLGLILIIMFPAIALWLPGYLYPTP